MSGPVTLLPYPADVADRVISDGWLKGQPFEAIAVVVGYSRRTLRHAIERLALPARDHKRRILPLEGAP